MNPNTPSSNAPSPRPASNQPATKIYAFEAESIRNSSHHNLKNNFSNTTTHSELFFKSFINLITRYPKTILFITTATILLTALKVLLATPLFTAESTLKIGTYMPALAGLMQEDILTQESQEYDYLNTQIELVKSLGVADQVLRDSSVRKRLHKHFQGRLFKPLSLSEASPQNSKEYVGDVNEIQTYLSSISVSPLRTTSLVKIRAQTSDPELSFYLANIHAESFIDFTRNQRHQVALENLSFLKNQGDELATKLSTAQKDLAEYAEKNSMISLDGGDSTIVEKRLSEISSQLTSATKNRIEAESALNKAKNLDLNLVNNESTTSLHLELDSLEAEYASLSQKYTSAYPKMRELSEKINSLKKSINTSGRKNRQILKAELEAWRNTETSLQKELDTQKNISFSTNKKQVEYNKLEREFESLKDLYQSVLKQLKESQIRSEAQGTNMSVIQRATLPLSPSSPRKRQSLILASIFGPLLGLLAAFFISLFDTIVRTKEEVAEITGLPVLGFIPKFSLIDHTNKNLISDNNKYSSKKVDYLEDNRAEEKQTNKPLKSQVEVANNPLTENPLNKIEILEPIVVTKNPMSVTSEVFRTIRTSIMLSSHRDKTRVMLVTSAKLGEGKTTVSTNLAVTQAMSGKKVLLIDADMRRPAIHRYFKIDSNRTGLVDILTGESSFSDAVINTSINNLDIVVAGDIPPNPAELLSTSELEKLIKSAEEYDSIIIDSPPIMPVTDSLIISSIVESVLLVVRNEKTPGPILREAINRLSQVNAHAIGVIINGTKKGYNSNYYYYKDMYQYYGCENEQPKNFFDNIKSQITDTISSQRWR